MHECAIMVSTAEIETPDPTTETMATDTDEEYNFVAEPKTKGGKAIIWQCEVYRTGPDDHNTGNR